MSSTTTNPLTDVKITSTTTIRNNLTNLPEPNATTTTTTSISTTTSTNHNNNTETTTQPMREADTTTSRSSSGTTNDYGPNKGPRVGDNNITESVVPNVTDTTTTTEWLPDTYTEHMVGFHVEQNSASTDPSEPTETTTIDGDDRTTTQSPKVRFDATYDNGESTAPTIFATDEKSMVVPNVVVVGTSKTVLPMQCNNANDCAPNERCNNNKCTKICDTTNSNRSNVDCIQGICK